MHVKEQGREALSRAPQSPTSDRSRTGSWKRLLVWALLLAFPLALLLGGMGPVHADDKEREELDKLSFYRLSSSMTALFSTAQEPNEDVELDNDGWQEILGSPANAGSMLGYPDEQFNIIRGWIDSRNAQSSNSVSYDSLAGNSQSGFQGVTGARDYAYFGATLNGLGLDGTSTGLTLGFFSWLAGGIVYILFVVAAEKLFLDSLSEYPQMRDVLLDQRNRDWLGQIEKFLQNGEDTLVVVGAAYLVGKNGLIEYIACRLHHARTSRGLSFAPACPRQMTQV